MGFPTTVLPELYASLRRLETASRRVTRTTHQIAARTLHGHPIRFTENGEPLEIETDSLTMSEILALVGKKPDELVPGREGRPRAERHSATPTSKSRSPRGRSSSRCSPAQSRRR